MARSRAARISQDLDSLVSIDAEEYILLGWGQNSDASVHSKKDKNNICNSIRINNSSSIPTTQKFVESDNNVTNTSTVPVTGHIGFLSVTCNSLSPNSSSNVPVTCKLKFYWYYPDTLLMTNHTYQFRDDRRSCIIIWSWYFMIWR